jgi:curved DNA-binding protein CbpA
MLRRNPSRLAFNIGKASKHVKPTAEPKKDDFAVFVKDLKEDHRQSAALEAERMHCELLRLRRTLATGRIPLGAESGHLWKSPSNRRMTLLPEKGPRGSIQSIIRNAVIACRCATRAIPCCIAQTQSTPKGIGAGLAMMAEYCVYGFVLSPITHTIFGVLHTAIWMINFYFRRVCYRAERGMYQSINLNRVRTELEAMEKKAALLYKAGDPKPDPSRIHTWLYENLSSVLPRRGAPAGGDDATHYQVLGVSMKASDTEIKSAYRELVKVLHPDARSGASGEGDSSQSKVDKETLQRFRRVTEAYKCLTNKDRRKAYDEGLRGGHFLAAGLADFDDSLKARIMAGLRIRGTKRKEESLAPAEILQFLFGGQTFEEYLIGPLYGSRYQLRKQLQKYFSEQEANALFEFEYDRLAIHLANLLDVWGSNPSGNGKDKAEKTTTTSIGVPHEINEVLSYLSKCNFGRELLFELGVVYEAIALEALGKAMPGSTPFKYFKRSFAAFTQAGKLVGEEVSEKGKSQEVMVGIALENEWVDISSQAFLMAYEVAQLCVYDRSVTKQQRKERATRLLALAHRMQQVGRSWHSVNREGKFEIVRRALLVGFHAKPLKWPTPSRD